MMDIFERKGAYEALVKAHRCFKVWPAADRLQGSRLM